MSLDKTTSSLIQQDDDTKSLIESDLYFPVKRFLESQDFKVKGEVEHCDIVAVRGQEELLVVELKLSF